MRFLFVISKRDSCRVRGELLERLGIEPIAAIEVIGRDDEICRACRSPALLCIDKWAEREERRGEDDTLTGYYRAALVRNKRPPKFSGFRLVTAYPMPSRPIDVRLDYSDTRPMPVGITQIHPVGEWAPIRSKVEEEPARTKPGGMRK